MKLNHCFYNCFSEWFRCFAYRECVTHQLVYKLEIKHVTMKYYVVKYVVNLISYNISMLTSIGTWNKRNVLHRILYNCAKYFIEFIIELDYACFLSILSKDKMLNRYSHLSKSFRKSWSLLLALFRDADWFFCSAFFDRLSLHILTVVYIKELII